MARSGQMQGSVGGGASLTHEVKRKEKGMQQGS